MQFSHCNVNKQVKFYQIKHRMLFDGTIQWAGPYIHQVLRRMHICMKRLVTTLFAYGAAK